jgi:hypothetical protein
MKVLFYCALFTVLVSGVGCGELDDEELELESTSQAVFATKTLGSMAFVGDSITSAFNAEYNSKTSCQYKDTPAYSYASNKVASNGTLSLAERAIAVKGADIPVYNVGTDGDKMMDGPTRANAAKSWALARPAPRLVTVFLGHNDICGTGGVSSKTNSSCRNSKQDPNNYCRTSNFAFEQDFRKMMDVLVTIPSSQIGIVHPLRVTQLCNFRSEVIAEELGIKVHCKNLWETVDLFSESGVCVSLTKDCSDARITDAYNTWAKYRSIAAAVVTQYNNVAAGATVPTNSTFGTGGVVKASGVSIQVTDAVANAKLNYKNASGQVQVSKCECFHPTRYGQDHIADMIWNGLTCSSATPCCDDVANFTSLHKGRCIYTKTDGSRIPGLWGVHSPTGWFDGFYSGKASGWACDQDDPAKSIAVHFYKGAPAGSGGVYVGAATANLTNEAAVTNICGGGTAHRFSYTVPNVTSGTKVYVYGIDVTGNGNALLGGSPKTVP